MIAPFVEDLQVGRAKTRCGKMGDQQVLAWRLTFGSLDVYNSVQEKHSDIKFVSFDTTEEKLEGLADELGVKALPAFKFFKACDRALPDTPSAPNTRCCALHGSNVLLFEPLQDGKEVVDAVTGYKKQPLQAGVQTLESL